MLWSIGLLLSTLVSVAPWNASPAGAVTVPQFDFDLVTRSCPNFVQLMPVFESTPGLNYTVEFTLTVRGDATALTPEVYTKQYQGYDFFDSNNNAPTIVEIADWSALGSNPRVEVTSTYGLGSASVTTSVGPSYNFSLTPASEPMLTRGSGTVADPFLVGTPTEVWDMGCYAGSTKNFRFDSDVDLAVYSQFMPLGSGSSWSGKPFSGSIDGAGHTIKNLRIVNPSLQELGFVGSGYNGLFIDNLRFEDSVVKGRVAVGVVMGRSSWMVGIRRVTVVDAAVTATEYGGLIIGDAEHAQITGSRTGGVVTGRPDAYTGEVGDSAAIGEHWSRDRVFAVGGVLGTADDDVLISDVKVNHTVNVVADKAERIGGLVGEMDTTVGLVTRVSGSVVVDITAREVGRGTSNVGGLFGGQGLEQASFTNSTIDVDMVVRAPVTADAVRLEEIGAVIGMSGDSHYDTLKITGRLVVDARSATGDVSMKLLGGFSGEQGDSSSNPSLIKNVDIAVDVTVLGSARSSSVEEPVAFVGAFAGNIRYNVVFDVVVSGSVTITGLADSVGGLIGRIDRDGSEDNPYTVLNGVVYRGLGVSVGVGSTNVGPVWGAITASVPPADAPFTNVWWDADLIDVNGIAVATAGTPARSATSAQLGDWDWLQASGFDMTVWCVSEGVPSIILLTPGCVSPLPFGAPAAPGQPTVTVSGSAVTVTWTAPANPGASPITGYVVTAVPGGATCLTNGALTCTFPSVANGTYTFVVQAENRSGTGLRSLPSLPVKINVYYGELPPTGSNGPTLILWGAVLIAAGFAARLGRRWGTR